MEGDDDEPSARLEHAFGGDEPLGEFAQFVVHEHAQRLERAGGRMNVARPRAHHARDNFGERAGGADRLRGAGVQDGAGDRARMAFLAERRR